MSEAERLLNELWAADEPPMRDAAFTVAVMEQVARRRLRQGIVMLSAMTAAAGAAVWALAPLAASASRSLSPTQAGAVLGPAAAGAFLAWAVWSLVVDPPHEAI